jgi:hypothetical protein
VEICTDSTTICSYCFRRCYRKRRHKGENTLYEEVEDAATSCSIEGSSNVKFLIARGRNINKSRIEQINEEWKTVNDKKIQNIMEREQKRYL